MSRSDLDSIPRNLFAWAKVFHDDLGFEVQSLGEPTAAAPGSLRKIAALEERIFRGQSLWHPDDEVGVGGVPPVVGCGVDEYRIAGDNSFGAVVGCDVGGNKHRYAIWSQLSQKSRKPLRLLYCTEGCGFADSFEYDVELAAIKRHASIHQASFVGVVSLFSVRARSALELKKAEYPVTGVGLLWARWLARYCDRVVVCWGDTKRLDRDLDYLWMLSRTAKGGRVYCVNDALPYPEKITPISVGLCRFEYRHLIVDREMEEREDFGDEYIGD